ncbi:MAG: MoxR family ATPase [Candidatus Cloacimonadota bacterium]|nr:MoxR family ATPase [Candidatus Cloacimonadota bacterium]
MKNKELIKNLVETKKKILVEIEKKIIGQSEVIEEFLVALFSGGHCMIEGVPGLAKTLVVSTIAQALNIKFSRIQFTPDLMPSDITGTDLLTAGNENEKRHFEYIKGPIFANIILADEINRTPPKTQAALLQAMQEYQITAGNITFDLDLPFLVIATQNPIEQEGTYPLPEAQLDRFMFKINIGYPSIDEEKEIVRTTTSGIDKKIEPVLNAQEIVKLQKAIQTIPVPDNVIDFAVKLVRRTRPDNKSAPDFVRTYINWGAGPRASQYLIIGAKTIAALNGRFTPAIADVKRIAKLVLQHRIQISFAAEAEGFTQEKIIDKLIDNIEEQIK